MIDIWAVDNPPFMVFIPDSPVPSGILPVPHYSSKWPNSLSLSLLVCLKFWPMPIAYLKIACFVHLQSGAEFTLRSYIDVHINPCSTCPPWQPGDVGLKFCWPPLRPQRFALISYWVPELSWDMMWSMKIRWLIELQFPTCQVRVPLFVTELHTPTRAHTPTHLDGHIYTH